MHAPDTVRDLQISRHRCRGKGYEGWMFAAGDGASRLARWFNNLVVQCKKCGARISIPAERADIPLDNAGGPKK